MNWKKGQWVRFEYLKPTKDVSGNYTGFLKSDYCYYRVRGIQMSKGTLTVEYPDSVFSFNDGCLIVNNEKIPHMKIVSLSKKDELWVNEKIKEKPDVVLIERNNNE